MLYTDALLEVRARLQELVPDFWLDNELYRAINEGVTRFSQEEKWPYLYTIAEDQEVAASAETVELVPGVAYERHFNMLLRFEGDARPRKPRRVHPSEGYDLRMHYSAGASEPLAYYISNTLRTNVDEVAALANVGDQAGTFTLTFGAQTTSTIARGATAAVIEAALVALSTIDTDEIEVSGGPLGDNEVIIRFVGDLGGANAAAITLGGTTTDMSITVRQTGGAVGGGVYVPVIRFVPVVNRAYTLEYQYIRDPILVASPTTESLDIPEEYAMGVCAFATGHAFLKELNFSAKAEEQFALYQKAVQDAKRESRKVTPDSGLVWGGQQPQYGWTGDAAELDYSIPELLGP
jgi:hypothetical protein